MLIQLYVLSVDIYYFLIIANPSRKALRPWYTLIYNRDSCFYIPHADIALRHRHDLTL